MTDATPGDRQIRTDIEMSVAARDGEIHLLFSERDQAGELRPAYTANMLLNAGDALTFSSLIADLAFEADVGLKAPAALKQELIDRHRAKLRDRLRVMLNSEREKRTLTNSQLARKLVDAMLHEVFS